MSLSDLAMRVWHPKRDAPLPSTWKTKDGRVLSISEMDDRHLRKGFLND